MTLDSQVRAPFPRILHAVVAGVHRLAGPPGHDRAAGASSSPLRSGTARREPLDMAGLAVLLAIALGGTLVAVAYAMGRAHTFGATAPFWLGQAFIFVPAAFYIFGQRGEASTQILILAAIAGIQAALVWAYSPDALRFPDELQHLRTARDILVSHRLNTPNPTLPVSPGFPGLEVMTTALSSMSGLSISAAGRIIASCSHMLVPVFLWGAFRALSGSDRISSIGVLLYSTDPHYGYFDVIWAYGTPGIAFLALLFRNITVSFRLRASRAPVVLAFVPLLVTHHLSALVGLLILLALSLSFLIAAPRPAARRLVSLTVGLFGLTVAYVAIVTPATFAYLGQPLGSIVAALNPADHSAATVQAGSLRLAPAWESLVEYLGAVITLALTAAGVLVFWLSDSRRSLKLFALGAFSYLAVLGIRVAAPNGSELASRALTYAMIFIAFAMAFAFAFARFSQARTGRLGLVATVAVFSVLIVATVVAAQPAAWERLPGRFYPAAQESGVDARTFAMDHWVSQQGWGRKVDVACDLQACAEIGAASDASPSTDSSKMYSTRNISAMDLQIAKVTLDYVQTDLRWTQSVPPTGSYWAQDPVQHTRPVPPWVLTRFDRDPLISRVYDDGDNRIYDTYWVWHR